MSTLYGEVKQWVQRYISQVPESLRLRLPVAPWLRTPAMSTRYMSRKGLTKILLFILVCKYVKINWQKLILKAEAALRVMYCIVSSFQKTVSGVRTCIIYGSLRHSGTLPHVGTTVVKVVCRAESLLTQQSHENTRKYQHTCVAVKVTKLIWFSKLSFFEFAVTCLYSVHEQCSWQRRPDEQKNLVLTTHFLVADKKSRGAFAALDMCCRQHRTLFWWLCCNSLP